MKITEDPVHIAQPIMQIVMKLMLYIFIAAGPHGLISLYATAKNCVNSVNSIAADKVVFKL